MKYCLAKWRDDSRPAFDAGHSDPDRRALTPRNAAPADTRIRSWRRRLMLVAVTTLASSLAAIAIAADDVPVKPPADTNDHPTASKQINQILEWLRDANVHAMLDLYQSATDPVVHVWAAMAIERTHFNLDAASRDAQLCEKTLSTSQPAIALLCGEFEAGDLRLAGNWQAAYEKGK